MASRIFLSQFSPQRTAPEHLESILVQREGLLAQAVELLRESVLTANKHHLLFVGPRGIGKTHLVTLIHHRLAAQADLSDRLRFAWLNEDETSTSFLKLLVRIHRDLAIRYPGEFAADILRKAIREEPETAQKQLGEALIQGLAGRTLVVLIENLDGLFERLSEVEQRTWRAFVQNHPVFATVASAQKLVAEVAKRDHPFFGFFDTRTLQPLNVEEARALLGRIATLNGDRELADYLDTARGRSRLRAIHYLAGGNPRLYILLSELVTRETLDDVVMTFEELADRQLTSFYQERLRWLSPQQQEIVQFLCLRRHPVPVKEIAENLFAGHSSITTQLKLLRELGYVVSHARGRESWYELAEPLMRLALEVKETHDQRPLALLVDFLRVWYDRTELEQKLDASGARTISESYLQEAILGYQSGDSNLRVELLRRGVQGLEPQRCGRDHLEVFGALALESNEEEDWVRFGTAALHVGDSKALDDVLAHAEEGSPTGPLSAVRRLAEVRKQLKNGQFTEALHACDDLLGSGLEDPAWMAYALWLRARANGKLLRYEAELSDYSRIIEIPGAPVARLAVAIYNRGCTHSHLGRSEAAFSDYTRVIELQGAPVEQVASALVNRGWMYSQLGQSEQAISDYSRVVELPGAPVEPVAMALVNRGVARGQLGHCEEEISDYSRAIELPGAPVETVAKSFLARGLAYGLMGQFEKEISDYSRLIDLPGAPLEEVASALINRGFTHRHFGRSEEALADLLRYLGLSDRNVIPNLWKEIAQPLTDLFLHCLFQTLSPSGAWRERAKILVETMAEVGDLPVVGNALVRHLATLPAGPSHGATLDSWREGWEWAAAGRREMELPLRLVRGGIEYLKTQDEGAFFCLAQEERRLVREALNLPEEGSER